MKILLAIDDSRFSQAAAQSLVKEFKPENTEVCVLTVVESLALMTPAYSYGAGPVFAQDYSAILEKWRSESQALVARAAQLLAAAGFKTSTVVCEGDAKSMILEHAEKWRPDLLLLGSHGRRGIDRFLLGSVSEGVARHARCSVQIARLAA